MTGCNWATDKEEGTKCGLFPWGKTMQWYCIRFLKLPSQITTNSFLAWTDRNASPYSTKGLKSESWCWQGGFLLEALEKNQLSASLLLLLLLLEFLLLSVHTPVCLHPHFCFSSCVFTLNDSCTFLKRVILSYILFFITIDTETFTILSFNLMLLLNSVEIEISYS